MDKHIVTEDGRYIIREDVAYVVTEEGDYLKTPVVSFRAVPETPLCFAAEQS